MIYEIDDAVGVVRLRDGAQVQEFALGSSEGFNAVSKAWLRAGWDAKYVYGFSWFGRPIIQLPDDMFRLQEVIYSVKPDLIVETGVAHGGSLVFHASLCKAMGRGRVVGVDIEIRPANRAAIEAHELSSLITLIEGSSTSTPVIDQVRKLIEPGNVVLVILDSNHTKAHVYNELEAYGPFVTPGSYIVATDGIMGDLVGAPRSSPDWDWNNPKLAAEQFASAHPEFVPQEPGFPFNEGMVTDRVTYWPRAFLRRV